MRLRRLVLGVFLLGVSTACATPIGVSLEDPQVLYRALNQSVLSTGQPTASTEQLLNRHDLTKLFAEDPEAGLEALRTLRVTRDLDRLWALAELSFLHARRSEKREHYLAAAIYAYMFLASPERRAGPIPAADPRVRLAADVYNLGLTFGLTVARPAAREGEDAPPGEVDLTDRTFALPFGRLEVHADPGIFFWGGGYRMTRFIPLVEYKVRGFRNRYRQPGLGVPLAAEVTPVISGPTGEIARKRIPPTIKVPVTAIVRLENVSAAFGDGQLRGRIEIYAADQSTTVAFDDLDIPLELEPTAALAYTLEGARVWDTELWGFLRGEEPLFGDGLVMMHPYRPGRVPVVLIHGTYSSPARWAEIINEVQNDPDLRERVQFWLFAYNTGNPIVVSARALRDALERVLTELDPEGRDPALRRMVLIGHSQGGLLARLMVTDSGTRFYDNASSVPLAELKSTPETRDLVQRTLFFKPLPFVTRVVFMATPHQGSFRVSNVVREVVRRLVTLPLRIVKVAVELATLNPELGLKSMPTSVDNMRPGHPFVRSLAERPPAQGVSAHSIIAVEGEGDPTGLNDGVVAYRSAHLDGVASEKIVQSNHSMQDRPETILEVRRILREHLGIR